MLLASKLHPRWFRDSSARMSASGEGGSTKSKWTTSSKPKRLSMSTTVVRFDLLRIIHLSTTREG